MANNWVMLFGGIMCMTGLSCGQLFISDVYALDDHYSCTSEINESYQDIEEQEYQKIELNCDGVAGTAYVFNSDSSTVVQLIRPVIMMDGFDPGDKTGLYDVRSISVPPSIFSPPSTSDPSRLGLYAKFNHLDMIQTVRDEGYAVIILNFDEGAGSIENNAFLLTKLIDTVNSNLKNDDEIVVIGPSMGGLISRYALTYMESENIDHNTRLFISFDTPHRGANIPLSNQYWLKYFSHNPKVQEIVDVLYTSAAKQMLVYHESSKALRPVLFEESSIFTSDELPQKDRQYLVTIPGPNVKFDDFFNELYELGNYPDNLRKIAISNGRGDGEEKFNGRHKLVVWEYESFSVDITGNTWSSSPGSNKLLFYGKIDKILDWGTTNKAKVFTSYAMSYDSAPGGYANTSALIADGSTMDLGNIFNHVVYETFIPTISALDIHTHDLSYRYEGLYTLEDDLFYNIRADPNILQKTPFDAIYYPTNDQEHVTITEENKQWILCEIFSTKHDSYDKYCSDTGIAEDVRNSPDNISNDVAESRNPDISGYSKKVGIVWESCDELCSPTTKSDILYAESKNFGETWDDAINISNNAGNSINPQIVVSNSNIYVIWEDNSRGSSNIFFKSTTNQFCSTIPFNLNWQTCNVAMSEAFTLPLIELSDSTLVSTNSKMVAVGDRVYVVWQDSSNISGDIFRTSN